MKSRFYSETGDTLDYTYELEGTPEDLVRDRGRPPTTRAPLARTARH